MLRKRTKIYRTRDLALLMLAVFGLAACAHQGGRGATAATGRTATTASAQAKAANVPSPSWVSEDCITVGDDYVFVGYGLDSANPASAIRNAMLAARQHALACVFGGQIKATVSINETNKEASYESNTELTLDYSHVNWSGFELRPGRVFYANANKTKIFAQYRWPVSVVTKERARLENLSKQLEANNALKQEVSLKSKLIEEQKLQLEQANRQEAELRALKSQSDIAAARIKNARDAHQHKKEEIYKVIKMTYCGITVGEFVEMFREPDEVSVRSGDSYLGPSTSVQLYWGPYIAYASAPVYKRSLNNGDGKSQAFISEIVGLVKTYKLQLFRFDYGMSKETHSVCN